MNVKELKKVFLRFWRSDNDKISLVRDITIALILVLILLLALWSYTGQWLSTPMVAIESGSMRHQDEPFGRLGTINAGDMVLLKKVDGKDDIVTRGSVCGGAYANKDKDCFSYGNYGDVIVYRKYGLADATQIIHRAMCWVEYNEEDDTYTVEEYCKDHVKSITIPELALDDYTPAHSGFITKGDNELTNPQCDQAGGICSEPIKPEWITGKARGELPWIGTINLLFDDIIKGFNDPKIYNVPGDCVVCLIIVLAGIISIPIALDLYDYKKTKKNKKEESNEESD